MEGSDRQSKKVSRQSPAAITKVKKSFASREWQMVNTKSKLPKSKSKLVKAKYFRQRKMAIGNEKDFSVAESGKWQSKKKDRLRKMAIGKRKSEIGNFQRGIGE